MFNLLRLVCLLSLPFCSIATADIIVTDDTQKQIKLPRAATRVISLAPHLTELVYSAGGGDKLVGVVSYSDFPAAARQIEQVGAYNNFDLERIISMQPDLILAWHSGNRSGQVKRLQELGYPVYLNEIRKLTDIAATIRQLGILLGNSQQATSAAESFLKRYQEIKQRYQSTLKKRGFYQVWHQPLLTVNGEHLINDVMSLCGIDNVFATLPSLTPQLEMEAVIVANPEIIIASGMDTARPEWLDRWQQWAQIDAVKKGHLYFIPPDVIQRASVRILDGAELMCRQAAGLSQ